MQAKKSSRGFTLYELVVTMAIASMVAGMGVPSFNSMMSNQRSTTSVNELAVSLNLARSEAVKRGKYVTICKSSNGATCAGEGTTWDAGWIVFVNDALVTVDTVDDDDEILRIHEGLNQTLEVTGSGSVVDFITYRPTGALGTPGQNFTGTLTFCDLNDNTDVRALVLTGIGRSRVAYDVDHLGENLTCAEEGG